MIELDNCTASGLMCSIDWLSFTVVEGDLEIESVLASFGFAIEDFFECPKGASGYKKMIILNDSTLRVLYDGLPNMGVHFDCTGSSVSDLVAAYRNSLMVDTPFGDKALDMDVVVLRRLLEDIQRIGHFTRIDLAIDNKVDIYFRVSELMDVIRADRFSTKFRQRQFLEDSSTTGVITGETVYLGRPGSDLLIRVYNKQLEQMMKHKGSDISFEWVRWEIQCRKERADLVVRSILECDNVGEVCVGILSNYFRIIVFDNERKTRCSNDIKWDAFLAGIEPIRLYVPPVPRTLEDKQEWITRQVAPTIAGLIIANHGDISFLTQHIDTHAQRMKGHLRELVNQAHPGWEECLQAFKD